MVQSVYKLPENLTIFAQLSCEATDEELVSKNLVGMTVACIGLIIVALFYSGISRLLTISKIDNAFIYMNQITVDDYTITIDIPE